MQECNVPIPQYTHHSITPVLQYSKKKWLKGCDGRSLVRLEHREEILMRDSVLPVVEEAGEGPCILSCYLRAFPLPDQRDNPSQSAFPLRDK